MKDKKDALDTLFPDLEKEPKHVCAKCGRQFDENDNDYLTFEGNVYVGEDKGLIGGNIPKLSSTDADGDKFRREDIRKTRICLSCFMSDMNNLKTQTLDDLKVKAEKLLKQIEQLSNDKSLDLSAFVKGQN